MTDITQPKLLYPVVSHFMVKRAGSVKNKSGLFSCPAICHTVILSLCLSAQRSVHLRSCLTDALTSVSQSVSQSVICMEETSAFTLLTFWKTFVLITKLKTLSVFLSVCLSVSLSVCLSVRLSACLSIFLTSCWHSEPVSYTHLTLPTNREV